MDPQPKKATAAASPQPPMPPSMTVAQAFTGLHLHENTDLADALEFFVRGYLDCASTATGLLRDVPRSCADQALKAFEHHDSWGGGDDGPPGHLPWDRLDRAWKRAAMLKLICHIRNGCSLAEHSADGDGDGGDELRLPRRARIEEDGDEDEGVAELAESLRDDDDERSSLASFRAPHDEEDDDDEEEEFLNLFEAKGKGKPKPLTSTGRTPLPASRRDTFPWELPSSSTSSPSQTAARRRGRHPSTVAPHHPSPTSLPNNNNNNNNNNMLKTVLATRATRRHNTRAASSGPSSPPPSKVTKKHHHQSKRRKPVAAPPAADKLWPFDDILDARRVADDVQYRVKWARGRPTWQPSLDLEDAAGEIAKFHARWPGKPGPPGWFVRGVARAGTIEEEGEAEE